MLGHTWHANALQTGVRTPTDEHGRSDTTAGLYTRTVARAPRRPAADSYSRSVARAFSISRMRVSAFFAFSIASTCSRLRL